MKTHVRIPSGQSIDSYLRKHRDPTAFYLEQGNYYTSGAFGFVDLDCCMLANGCALIGAGKEETTIWLESPITHVHGENANYCEALTGGARKVGSASRIRMEGFTLEVPQAFPVVAIHIWGERSTVKDVHVNGVAGKRDWTTRPNEGFGILMANSGEPGEINGGNSVINCEVIQPDIGKENYSTGIYIGMIRNGKPMLRSRIENCAVLSNDGHAAYAFNDDTDVVNCQSYGHRRAIFMDTGPVRCSSVRRLHAQEIGWAMDLRQCHPGDIRQAITVEDSEFGFRLIDGHAQAVLLDDTGGTAEIAEGIAFNRCRFVAPAGSEGVRSMGRVRGKNAFQPRYTECNFLGLRWETVIVQGVRA